MKEGNIKSNVKDPGRKVRPKSGPPAPKTFLSRKGREVQVHYKETDYGFEYGSAKVTRFHSDPKEGWVIIGIDTPKIKLQVYVTKTGKVRVFNNGEWLSPDALEKTLIGKLLSKLDKE
jgi:hypothetical protein